MKESGVTLLELLITMTIVMVLASVAMPLGRLSAKRTHEIELRQQLRIMRAAIDTFKLEWNRDRDLLLGAACIKNKLTCKDVTSVYGYPKSLDKLLEIKLTSEEAMVRGTTTKRYLRTLPLDPMTGKADWILRCYKDSPKALSWCGDDVYDVMTQSEDMALDGTKYRDW
ncbi:MAG: type II secretion system GspH family protein [Nitrospira sp.]|nr:type II secretion system GspH family protein [Nitrospira sp.]